MSINLKKVYFKKLEEYVGKKLNIVSNKNEITIIYVNCPLCQGHFELV